MEMIEQEGASRFGSRSITLKIPPDARYAGYVRAQVLALAANAMVWESDLSDFATAVGEALANAVEHAGTDQTIEIRCKIDPFTLVAVISDRGHGFDAKKKMKKPLPDVLSERGRGLPLMRAYCDIVKVKSGSAGTSVKLALLLRNPRHRASKEQLAAEHAAAAHPIAQISQGAIED